MFRVYKNAATIAATLMFLWHMPTFTPHPGNLFTNKWFTRPYSDNGRTSQISTQLESESGPSHDLPSSELIHTEINLTASSPVSAHPSVVRITSSYVPLSWITKNITHFLPLCFPKKNTTSASAYECQSPSPFLPNKVRYVHYFLIANSYLLTTNLW